MSAKQILFQQCASAHALVVVACVAVWAVLAGFPLSVLQKVILGAVRFVPYPSHLKTLGNNIRTNWRHSFSTILSTSLSAHSLTSICCCSNATIGVEWTIRVSDTYFMSAIFISESLHTFPREMLCSFRFHQHVIFIAPSANAFFVHIECLAYLPLFTSICMIDNFQLEWSRNFMMVSPQLSTLLRQTK